jgi:hypothetical protein
LEIAGHHGEAVASYQLPVASENNRKRMETAFKNAGAFIVHLLFENLLRMAYGPQGLKPEA